jgi:hypothetical protein
MRDMSALANVVRTVTLAAVWLIVVALVLVLLDADPAKAVVSGIGEAGSWLTVPFHGVFDMGAERADLAADWGLAALVYGIAGGTVSRLLLAAAGRDRVARTTAVR